MRCKACNVILSDFEVTRKSADTNEYMDLCNVCFAPISNECYVLERFDLLENEDSNEDGFEDTSL
jgi:hypothetical protein